MQINKAHAKAQTVASKIKKKYRSAQADIEKEVMAFIGKYEYEEYNSPAILDQDNLAYFNVHGKMPSNMELLLFKVSGYFEDLLTTEEDLLTDHLQEVYTDILQDLQLMAQALSFKWTGHNYQDNLRENNRKSTVRLRREVNAAMVRKDSKKQIKYSLDRLFAAALSGSMKILNTETTYVNNTALIDLFGKQGYKKYVYVARMDNKTCSVCRDLHGREFYLAEAIPGVNYPPIHPNDRCTIQELK